MDEAPDEAEAIAAVERAVADPANAFGSGAAAAVEALLKTGAHRDGDEAAAAALAGAADAAARAFSAPGEPGAEARKDLRATAEALCDALLEIDAGAAGEAAQDAGAHSPSPVGTGARARASR